MTASRRLAAILAADVAGYSRLMGADEEGKQERLKMPLNKFMLSRGGPSPSSPFRCGSRRGRRGGS